VLSGLFSDDLAHCSSPSTFEMKWILCVFDSIGELKCVGTGFLAWLGAHIELNIDTHALTVSRPVQHKRVKRMRCKKDGRTEQTNASADAAVACVVADAV
jgi:hypothetical protein